jgi:uncharacterized protein YgiM (DUF1202 family)
MSFKVVLAVIVLIGSLAAAIAAPAPAGAVSCGPCPGTATDNVNLREGPSLADDVILVIPAGAELEWDSFGDQANGYVPVTYDGVDGYAHGDYLLLFPAFGTTTDWLNLREEPSRNSAVLDVMPPGADVQLLGGPENGFYAVRYDQRIAGYAHGDYIDIQRGGEFAPGDEVGVATDALNLRGGAGLNKSVRAVLPQGTQLVIEAGPSEADGFTWYRVDAGGYGGGWVAGEYLARV